MARAINGSPLIKEETKRKVLKLVKETNYKKNMVGSFLADTKGKKVCAMIAKSKNEFYTSEIQRGLISVLEEYKDYNYKINVKKSDINNPMEQIEKLRKILSDKELDGLIITPLDREKIYKILKPYLQRIKVISLGIRLHKDIPHIGPDHVKQGRMVGGLLEKLLRKGEKILVIDNGDDKISSKKYLIGFLNKLKNSDVEILGPYQCKNIDESREFIIKKLKTEEIMGIYINRYAQDILEKIPRELLKDKKIVTNGIGNIIKRLIKERVISMTIKEEIFNEGYIAGKNMFETLYKNVKIESWNISKSHIICYENIDDEIK